MIWKKCLLKAREKVGEDALKNPVYEWKTVKKTRARSTPWTDEQIALEGREITRNEQRFAIPISFDQFPECTHAVIDGRRQKIKEKIDLTPRYTVIQVEAYKE